MSQQEFPRLLPPLAFRLLLAEGTTANAPRQSDPDRSGFFFHRTGTTGAKTVTINGARFVIV